MALSFMALTNGLCSTYRANKLLDTSPLLTHFNAKLPVLFFTLIVSTSSAVVGADVNIDSDEFQSITRFGKHQIGLYTGSVNRSPKAIITGPAVAELGANPSATVSLDGSESSDPEDGGVNTYSWEVNTSASISSATASQVNITFSEPGSYLVTLTVSDSEGLTTSTVKTVAVYYDLSLRVDPDAALKGQWSEVFDWPLVAIHAVLLPDGQPFTFGSGDFDVDGKQYFYSLWDPTTGNHDVLPNTTDVNFFCSGPVLTASSGRVFMPGGDALDIEGYDNGIVNTPVFHTQDRTLSYNQQFDMNIGRWYPSTIVLSNGSLHVMGGTDVAGNTSVTPEIFETNAENPFWRSLFGASIQSLVDKDENSYFYPRQWVVPGWEGQLFGFAEQTMFRIDPTTTSGDYEDLGTLPITSWGFYSSAVMYEPGKILQVGGNGSGQFDGFGATIIDLTNTTVAAPAPAFTTNRSMFMSINRKAWLDATVLPDGSVFVNGGSSEPNALAGDTLTTELWQPDTNSFSTMASATQARLYHSSSLLLPDATVLVAGGGTPGPQTNLNAEIFFPPYLFNNNGRRKQAADRIDFQELSSLAYGYGGSVSANYSGPRVTAVSLVKTGAVTHSINLEQRRIPIDSFSHQGVGSVEITLPDDPTVATPGYYMLFLIDGAGTPSVAQIIEIK